MSPCPLPKWSSDVKIVQKINFEHIKNLDNCTLIVPSFSCLVTSFYVCVYSTELYVIQFLKKDEVGKLQNVNETFIEIFN